MNGVGDLLTKNTEKAEILNALFTSVFTCKTSLQESVEQGIFTLSGRGLNSGIFK